jgi:hypothetical protein
MKCSHRIERRKSIREAGRDKQTRAGCKEGKKITNRPTVFWDRYPAMSGSV